MGERFNVALATTNTFTPKQRAEFILSLRNTFRLFFEEVSEVCLIDYCARTSRCEPWTSGKDFLTTDISTNELLFVYGASQGNAPRSSIHFEQGQFGTVFVASLSIPLDYRADSVASSSAYLSGICDLIEPLAGLSFVGAGWELEFDASSTIEQDVDDFLADSSLYCWVGLPRHLVRDAPNGFNKVLESSKMSFFNREPRSTSE